MKKRTVLITAAILGLLLVSGNDFGTNERGALGLNDFQTAENGALG
ncbi:hypothetical protein LT978_19980 (plasmid) [Bacillus amyloliquefaciens]|nr:MULTISPECIES: hypothetical protein [Bacillus amyloliquefaciens group]MCX2886568.1 hypothetical protein [Bacillus velezensis]QVL41441.1 hypothetical protein KH263_19585 [Bacillus velezensis]ULR37154.1 hypothetical protein MG974_19230 [Bacillus velezensis]USP46268.1 hypothetical protein LT978_19980 [Bacillus amyloliquefaciens]WGS36286.1 hypothetical protein PO845_00025 [Bacillus velezensis]